MRIIIVCSDKPVPHTRCKSMSHISFPVLFCGFPNIADLHRYFSPWWKNKMGTSTISCYQYLWCKNKPADHPALYYLYAPVLYQERSSACTNINGIPCTHLYAHCDDEIPSSESHNIDNNNDNLSRLPICLLLQNCCRCIYRV